MGRVYSESEWAEVDALLGKITDHEIAANFPMSRTAISRRRREKKITPAKGAPVRASESFKRHCVEVYRRVGNYKLAAQEIGNVSHNSIRKWVMKDQTISNLLRAWR